MLLCEGKHVFLATQPGELQSKWHGVTTLQRTLFPPSLFPKGTLFWGSFLATVSQHENALEVWEPLQNSIVTKCTIYSLKIGLASLVWVLTLKGQLLFKILTQKGSVSLWLCCFFPHTVFMYCLLDKTSTFEANSTYSPFLFQVFTKHFYTIFPLNMVTSYDLTQLTGTQNESLFSFSNTLFSSLHALWRSSFTSTVSIKWPYCSSMNAAELIISCCSSSCWSTQDVGMTFTACLSSY